MKFCFKTFFCLILISSYSFYARPIGLWADEPLSSLKLLYSEKKIVRDKAAYRLAKQGTKEARREFISLIQTASGDLKETSIIALGMLEAKNTDLQKRSVSLDILYEQLKDKNCRIRQATSIALGIIEDEKATSHLKKLFNDCSSVREAAKSALDRIEYSAKSKEIENLWKKGDKKLDEGNLKESFSFFKQIIVQDEENKFGFSDDAEFSLGYIYGREGKHKKAISIFNNLLDKYPNYKKRDKALYCLALCYLNIRKYKAGKEALLLLKQEFPDGQITKNTQGLLGRLEE